MKKLLLFLFLLSLGKNMLAQGYNIQVCVNLSGPPLNNSVVVNHTYFTGFFSNTQTVTVPPVALPYNFCFPVFLAMPDSGNLAFISGTISMPNCQSISYNAMVFGDTTLTLNYQNCGNTGSVCSASIGAGGPAGNVLSAYSQGVPPYTYIWSTGANTPSITVTTTGTYCVAVTDANGCMDSVCYFFQGSGGGCTAAISPYVDPVTGSTTLYAVADSSSPVATYAWSNNQIGSSIMPTTAGTYCVAITYVNGCTATACYSYTPGGSNTCSVMAYAYPDSMVAGLVYFTAMPSGTAPFTYVWYFSDGSTSTQASPSHNFGMVSPGLMWAMVQVTDATGCVAYYSFIIPPFNNVPSSCQADFLPYANYSGATPGEIMFTDLSNTANLNPPASYSWDFGDGTTSNLQNPTHVYASSGYYYVCLTVSNTASCMSSFCTTIYVDLSWWGSNPYQGNCTAGYVVFPGQPSNGMTNIVNTSQGNNLIYSWSLGNGTSATGPTPFFTFSNSGSYVVCLSIEDTVSGCTDTFCDTLFVDSLGFISRSPLNGNVGVRVSLGPQPMNLTGMAEKSGESIALFPNPSNGIMTIAGQKAGGIIEIYNNQGQKVFNTMSRAGNMELDLSNLPSGSYFLRSISEDQIRHGRFVLKN